MAKNQLTKLSTISEENDSKAPLKKKSIWSKVKSILSKLHKSKSQNGGTGEKLPVGRTGDRSNRNNGAQLWFDHQTLRAIDSKLISKRSKNIPSDGFTIKCNGQPSYKLTSHGQNEYAVCPSVCSRLQDPRIIAWKETNKKMQGFVDTNSTILHGATEASSWFSIHGEHQIEESNITNATECDLYLLNNKVYKICDFSYPWLQISAFKVPASGKNETKSSKAEKFSKQQSFILIKKKSTSELKHQQSGDVIQKTLVYLHRNGEDIGNVLGHCVDLSSRLDCSVLIPELSGFGGYNCHLSATKDKNLMKKAWVGDVENSLRVAQEINKSEDLNNITVYAKGMSTSIVFELMKTWKLKSVIIENSCYAKSKDGYLSDFKKALKKSQLPKLKLENSLMRSESYQEVCEPSSGCLPHEVPRFLIIDREGSHQRMQSNDIISSLLSRIQNLGKKDTSEMKRQLDQDYNQFILQNGHRTTDNLHGGCIRHVSFSCNNRVNFKREHRSEFLTALRWIMQ